MRNNPRFRTTISIRITIGVLFLLVTTLTATLALSIHYHFIHQTLKNQQLDKFSSLATSISQDMTETDQLMRQISTALGHSVTPSQSEQQWLSLFTTLLESTPSLYSVYVASSNDDFYQVINLNSGHLLRKQMGALGGDRWVVSVIKDNQQGKRIKSVSFLNEALEVRETLTQSSRYFPSQRPWYQQALSQGVIKTEPYLFQHLAVSGQTYARTTPKGALVIGLDVLLSTLSEKLTHSFEQQLGRAMIFRNTGELLADTQPVQADKPLPLLPHLKLTPEQHALVQSLGTLRVSNQRNWAPIDFSVLGEPRGYAIDILTMIGQMTGIRWEFINGLDWSELVNQFNHGALEVIHSLQNHKDGYVKGVFSEPIFSLPFGVLVPSDLSQTRDISEFNGKKVAILSGWSIIHQLRNRYPSIEIVEVSDIMNGLQLLKSREVVGFIDSSDILQHAVNHYFSEGVTLLNDIAPFNQGFKTQFHIALRTQYDRLLPIINEAVQVIMDTQVPFLRDKWLSAAGSAQNRLIPHAIFYDFIQSPDQQGKLIQASTELGDAYVYIQPVGSSLKQEFFAVIVPTSILESQVMAQVMRATSISALLMLPMLVLAWFSGVPIIRAIHALKGETIKVKKRRYKEVSRVKTRIKEIAQLSESVIQMAHQLQKHEKQQETLLDSIVQLIAKAIDEKSPYTAGHCNRVPEIGMMLAEAVEALEEGPFKDFRFNSDQEKREFSLASWLHDCGKLTVPEHIVDKGTKLEANYNRIHEIRMRFEVLWRDVELSYYHKRQAGESESALTPWLHAQQTRLQEEFEFIATLNTGDALTTDSDIERLNVIGRQTWERHFDDTIGLSHVEKSRLTESSPLNQPLLKDAPEHYILRHTFPCYEHGIKMKAPEYLSNLGEIYNLSVERGTLTLEDRYRINEHMVSGIKMLESLPFPDELKQVPRIATTHHETLTGTGYPRQLGEQELSIKDRILAIADIFEALTAADRPYKKAFKLSHALSIMQEMAERKHIDGDLLSVFIEQGIHIKYAERFLTPEQIDVDKDE